ncbi:MAG TPA: DUF72 domain-containing protein [Chloroflexota bacterium]|nr:DUF72 domain-containing protein [Chloroflexota bacterium]
MGQILTGTSSWTDPTLLTSGWYPPDADTPATRLEYYASRFPLVEVDSTYYGLPAERTAVLWADRTPDHFTFDFKAFRLFTDHPTPIKALPKKVRDALPDSLKDKRNIYRKDLPKDVVDDIYRMYRQALMPVHSAGKMGAVFFQYPHWFYFSRENMQRILEAREHFPDYRVAVEFRQPSWLSEENREKTFDFLRENDLAYVAVDEPQGTRASIPPLAAATTAQLSVVRFHGRREETWVARDVGVEERFKYCYSEGELQEWVPKVERLAAETQQTHVLMNNCYSDYGVRNAQQMALLLQADGAPVARA